MKLGSLSLKSRVLLSPLEGVSDLGFRSLCASLGAGLTWTEMVRAQGIAKNNAATLSLIDTHDASVPTGLQLMTKSATELTAALKRLEEIAREHEERVGTPHHFQHIQAVDLNFGCPSKEILRIGAGPALLKRQAKLREILTALRAWKETTSLRNIGAVGCKIRLGLNASEQSHGVYLSVARIANEVGMDYLTVHGRHAAQRSSSPATWKEIKEIKAMSSIPIIGNGDVWSAEDAKRMIESTGCDGVMVARTAIRNPWVFRDFISLFDSNNNNNKASGSNSIPTREEVLSAIQAYELHCKRFGTKPKYQEFNLFNLNRILKSVSENAKQIEYVGPKTVHL